MRTTLTLDDAVLLAAKEYARLTGHSIGNIISGWALKGLQSPYSSPSKKRSTSFPSFDIPSNTSPITSQHVHQLLTDEGLSAGH